LRERLKILISATKLNQKEFSERIGVTSSALTQFLKGKSKGLNSDTLISIINEFQVNPNWLLTGEGDMFLPGKGPAARGPSQELSNTNLDVIDGKANEYPELNILPKVAHTAWWQQLSETEREIIVFITHIKDTETKKKLRDLIELALKKEISEEEFKKQLNIIDDPKLRQKGAAG
jgi:transcriptional regulator with XRE-family HTH domain